MGSPPNAACAACKFQRRKCAVDCLLAPWFPPDQPRRFANAHRLFGVANILRLIRENRSSVEDLMKSVCFESDTRERDPVNGAYGTLRLLQREAERLEEDRTALSERLRILLLEDAAANNVNNAPHTHTAYNAVPPEYYAHARPTQVAFTEATPALQDNDVYHMQHHHHQHQQQQHQHHQHHQQQQQPHQQQQQLHYMQMPQHQMPSLEYFVNFNASGGFTPVQATDASTSHPLMQLTDRSAEVPLHRASSSYTGTAARDFLSLTNNSNSRFY
ncbi:protein MpASLBD11 [Marchantia polymorpha subsp. ruderalis]|uniref:LOB domain-containing protein n=2 Tax=Marchantia polymorpha TaxID=3197 RepID=A0AAF6BH43_MARPO|nr:hypothetical protein MARPO_0093s0018 [Marchantia polymorpha]BBN11327.1 hypothetical protein Mp_5g10960 [Marchantia polymorpha subsp. ruderalis]|eukprot:PTQ32935.1 hypothetical protein MARPO_0093s0018 [Marchantia polymorpha]